MPGRVLREGEGGGEKGESGEGEEAAEGLLGEKGHMCGSVRFCFVFRAKSKCGDARLRWHVRSG